MTLFDLPFWKTTATAFIVLIVVRGRSAIGIRARPIRSLSVLPDSTGLRGNHRVTCFACKGFLEFFHIPIRILPARSALTEWFRIIKNSRKPLHAKQVTRWFPRKPVESGSTLKLRIGRARIPIALLPRTTIRTMKAVAVVFQNGRSNNVMGQLKNRALSRRGFAAAIAASPLLAQTPAPAPAPEQRQGTKPEVAPFGATL